MGVGRDARQPRRRESPVEVGTELANDVHTQQPKLLSCTRGGGGGGDGLGWWLGGSWRAARMHRAAAACTLAKGDAPISLPLLLSSPQIRCQPLEDAPS